MWNNARHARRVVRYECLIHSLTTREVIVLTPIYLDRSQVPASLRGSYSGNKFKAYVTEHMTVPATAGLWDGGSRDTYSAYRLADGAQVQFPGQHLSPWDNRKDQQVTMQPGIAIIEHSVFCGKDMGLTFYLHPTDAAPMLPAPQADLTAVEALVLEYTISRKSSYQGKDRYAMALDDYRYREGAPLFPKRAQWDEAKAALITRGYLNKAGAVTTAGRNARVR